MNNLSETIFENLNNLLGNEEQGLRQIFNHDAEFLVQEMIEHGALEESVDSDQAIEFVEQWKNNTSSTIVGGELSVS